MRFAGALLGALFFGHAATAADYDGGPLRGSYLPPPPPPVGNWEGVYFGGFGGLSQADLGFGKSLAPLVVGFTRNTVLEKEFAISGLLHPGSDDARKASFGGFAGYNMQLGEIVLGVEFDYTRTRLAGQASDAIARQMNTSDGFLNEVVLSGNARTELHDVGTARFRAGYAMGAFMPFVTGGIALGRADVSKSVSVQTAGYHVAARDAVYAQFLKDGTVGPVPTYGYAFFDPITLDRILAPGLTDSVKKEVYSVGLTGGFGIEMQLTPNLLLRGEYQYVQFSGFEDNKVTLNTVRGGAALKF